MGQLVSGQDAIAVARGGADRPVRGASANRFVKDVMFQYFLRGQDCAKGMRSFSMATDAGRVGSHDLQVTAVWICERQLALWAPPQAHRVGGKSQVRFGRNLS